DFWSLLCRGRKKKIVSLVIFLLCLLNAMFYVSLELYNLNLRFDKNSYVDNTGMRVIVGHYVGGSTGGNLSAEVIHGNNYAPVEGAGEGGRPVQLSPRELIKARELYSLHSYNIVVGDRVSINRTLPDMRSDSVIIVFHNEAWSTLMRTVMSVLLRSPEALLKQVILVDDASDRRYLGRELEDAVAKLDRIRILRSATRTGLVTQGWLEPLLDRAGSDDVWVQKGPRLKTKGGTCLTLATSNKNKNGVDEPLTAKRCVTKDEQIWHFERVPW
ncbi:Polypeptide N-acetylgalactosaminyltransferase 3, partial [Operophtera brumata]